MAATKKKKKKEVEVAPRESLFSDLTEGTIRGVIGISFFVLAAVLILAATGSAGYVGGMVFTGLSYLFGVGYYLIPLLLLVLSVTFFRSNSPNFRLWSLISSTLLLVSGLGLIETFFVNEGGLAGHLIASPLQSAVDVYATVIILFALFVISLFILLDTQLQIDLSPLWEKLQKRREAVLEDSNAEAEIRESTYLEEEGEEPTEEAREEDTDEPASPALPVEPELDIKEFSSEKSSGRFWRPVGTYNPPPVSLLEKDRGKPGVGDTKANANIIKRTLQNFGIQVDMDEITVGPTVTRYSLKPAEGVRISKIVSLQSNLELALAASPIRIEAPIPGRSLVGIEVPNSAKTTLGLASLLGSADFQDNKKHLMIALGRDITGVPHYADVAKMPHGLIAGTTGSGKSVTIHDAVISLLYRNGPDMLRLIMIDPKRVELTLYNGIPHLLTPVITDAKKAILALKWAAREMSRRYDILEAESVRDITSYHTTVYGPAVEKGAGKEDTALPEPMPYIVIIIDELADIMQTFPRELEASIVRLAQMSRAVGIHLLLSTQRPSVNVITGLIKANVPTRLALQVASQIDSRTILDGSGAEKLLGAGDTLYLSGDMAKPVRIQAPYITELEVKNVVNYIKKHNDSLQSGIDLSGNSSDPNAIFSATLEDDASDEDDLYGEARNAVVQAGKASTSYLQRKLGVGYSRAAKLMDLLESKGVIGPADGSKPREILGAGGSTPQGAGDNNDDLV